LPSDGFGEAQEAGTEAAQAYYGDAEYQPPSTYTEDEGVYSTLNPLSAAHPGTEEQSGEEYYRQAYAEEGTTGQESYGGGEAAGYEEADGSGAAEPYAAQGEGYGEGDAYQMVEEGLQQPQAEEGGEEVVPEYKRKGERLSINTRNDARVYIAPSDALSPTTYDYNKDMWGDMWSYDAPNPVEVGVSGGRPPLP
jgi:hypothetical protein